jgi:hypothetical protein
MAELASDSIAVDVAEMIRSCVQRSHVVNYVVDRRWLPDTTCHISMISIVAKTLNTAIKPIFAPPNSETEDCDSSDYYLSSTTPLLSGYVYCRTLKQPACVAEANASVASAELRMCEVR